MEREEFTNLLESLRANLREQLRDLGVKDAELLRLIEGEYYKCFMKHRHEGIEKIFEMALQEMSAARRAEGDEKKQHLARAAALLALAEEKLEED